MRDGTQQVVEISGRQDFVATTSDGWLMIDAPLGSSGDTLTIYHYRLIDDGIETIPLIEVPDGPDGFAALQILESSFAAGSQLDIPFQTVPVPVNNSLG